MGRTGRSALRRLQRLAYAAWRKTILSMTHIVALPRQRYVIGARSGDGRCESYRAVGFVDIQMEPAQHAMRFVERDGEMDLRPAG